jgi:hypothetical protein
MFGNSIEARTRVADRVLPLVARIPNPILRDACGQKVAAVLGVSTGAVEESVRQHGLSLGSGLRDVRSLGASPVPAESLAKPALVRPISRAEIGMIRLLVESVRARAVLLPAMERERLHVGLTVEPIVSILLNRPVSPLPNYHDLIEELSGTGLESAVSAIAVDSEPLDDGDRTLQVVLARLRREKSLRKLRQVTSGGFAGMDGADMAEIPAEGGAELSPGEWETLESAPQASLTQQDDLFSRMTVAHQAATEAVENARALYSHGEDTPRIRP